MFAGLFDFVSVPSKLRYSGWLTFVLFSATVLVPEQRGSAARGSVQSKGALKYTALLEEA